MNAMQLAILIDAASSLRRIRNTERLGFKYTTASLDDAIQAAVDKLDSVVLDETGAQEGGQAAEEPKHHEPK